MASSSHRIPLRKGKIRLTGYTPKHPDLGSTHCAPVRSPRRAKFAAYVRHWENGGSVRVHVYLQVSEPCWVPDRLWGLSSVTFLLCAND